MSAIQAMDEMMSANEINMNLAAITPGLIVSYAVQRVFGFMFYALLELGKSQEETYASFRNILTYIKRLFSDERQPAEVTASHQRCVPTRRRHSLDYRKNRVPW